MVRYIGEFSDNPSGVASENMRRAEENASGAANEGDTSGFSAGTEESSPGGLYTGVGKDGDDGKKEGKGKGKGILRGKGPLAAIFTLILTAGGFMVGGQTLLPFSLADQLMETFDSIKISSTLRTDTIWSKQMAKDTLTKNPLHRKFFGFGGDTFKVRNKQKTKLANQGIYVTEADVGEGKTKTVMLFDDGSGKLKVVAAADGDVAVIKGLAPEKIDVSSIDADVSIKRMDIDVDSTVTFRAAYNDVPDFRNGYISGSRTWRGSVSAWFDALTVRFLQSNNLTRNLFKDFQKRVQAEQEGNTRSAMTKMMDTGPEELEAGYRGHNNEVEYKKNDDGTFVLDDNGNKIPVDANTTPVDHSTTIKMKGATKAEIKAKLDEIKNGKLGKASGIASLASNLVCTVMDVIGTINLVIMAKEVIEVMGVTTNFLEAVDKVKSGDGADSPINVLAESLVTPRATTIMQNTDNSKSAIESDEGVEIKEVVAKGKEDTTAMQAAGIVGVFSGKEVSYNDASVQNFNMGSRFKSILGRLTNSITSFSACALAKAAAAAVDAVIDLISIIACAASFGIGCVVEALVDAGSTAAASIGIAVGANIAINIIMPWAVKVFTRDLVSNLFGEDFGNALVSGANIYLGNNHLQGGGSLATYNKYVAYRLEQESVIAEEARYQRETRSPFDVTSQYTFAGSMLKQLAIMHTMPSSMFGFLGGAMRMMSSSVVSMLPSASAYDIATTVRPADDPEYENNCPFLSQIGAVGDAYCNPYMITDVSTINKDPLDVVDYIDAKGGFDSDGNIKKTSNLARYITYCGQRGSTFGVADSRIAGDFAVADVDTGQSTVNAVLNGAIGAIPVLGDALDIVNNSNQLANTGWITGQSCVASGSNLVSDGGKSYGTSWSENKYYQRFVEDQRLMESINPGYESPITAFLREYDEEHPIDNTYEGVLAYKTGLPKEKIVAMIDLIDYWNYLEDYDASTRYAFGAPAVEEKHDLIFDNENQVAETIHIILLNEISFADIRNRVALV